MVAGWMDEDMRHCLSPWKEWLIVLSWIVFWSIHSFHSRPGSSVFSLILGDEERWWVTSNWLPAVIHDSSSTSSSSMVGMGHSIILSVRQTHPSWHSWWQALRGGGHNLQLECQDNNQASSSPENYGDADRVAPGWWTASCPVQKTGLSLWSSSLLSRDVYLHFSQVVYGAGEWSKKDQQHLDPDRAVWTLMKMNEERRFICSNNCRSVVSLQLRREGGAMKKCLFFLLPFDPFLQTKVMMMKDQRIMHLLVSDPDSQTRETVAADTIGFVQVNREEEVCNFSSTCHLERKPSSGPLKWHGLWRRSQALVIHRP